MPGTPVLQQSGGLGSSCFAFQSGTLGRQWEDGQHLCSPATHMGVLGEVSGYWLSTCLALTTAVILGEYNKCMQGNTQEPVSAQGSTVQVQPFQGCWQKRDGFPTLDGVRRTGWRRDCSQGTKGGWNPRQHWQTHFFGLQLVHVGVPTLPCPGVVATDADAQPGHVSWPWILSQGEEGPFKAFLQLD